jgi:hypothetical protein
VLRVDLGRSASLRRRTSAVDTQRPSPTTRTRKWGDLASLSTFASPFGRNIRFSGCQRRSPWS